MALKKLKSITSAWLQAPKSIVLSYFCFSFIVGFSIYEAQYFLTFEWIEFFEYLAALFGVAFSVAFLVSCNSKILKFIGLILFFITMGLNIFYSGHHLIYGTPPTSNVYVSLFETNSSETMEFLESYVDFKIILKISLEFIVSLLVFLLLKSTQTRGRKPYLYLCLFFFLVNPFTYENLKLKSPYRFINQYVIYKNEKQKFRNSFSNKPPEDLVVTQKGSLDEDTVILVIGESASRKRMSLYGYFRETNPLLKARNDLYVFNNVISPHSHTVPSLEKALTFLNSDNEKTLKRNANIIQFAKLANYKTVWISNQPPLGEDETPLNIMANNADQTFWLSDSASFRYNKSFDGSILPILNKVLEAKVKKQFIVLHLIGAHTNYKHRSPSKFKKFHDNFKHSLSLTPEQWEDYNNYDNAILYNDFVVNSIIDMAKDSAHSTVLYFSDHGEEVYDERYIKGHTEALSSPRMFEVPFLVYSNNPKFKEKLHAMPAKKNDLWSIEDLIHSLHDIFSIESTYYQPKRSLFSTEFSPIPRTMAGIPYGPSTQLNCQAKGMFTPSDKIWVHRVNTLERFQILKDDFAGFEVDIVWDKNKNFFDVYHPPVKSIDLNLERILEADKSKEKYFWFDLKNLETENVASILAAFELLDEKYQLKKRVLIESHMPELLKSIRAAGFHTSFYLPGLKKIKRSKYAASVLPLVSSYHSAISQSGSMIELMDAKFSGCDKLLWILGDESEDKEKISELKNRDDIKVILVKKKTDHRR